MGLMDDQTAEIVTGITGSGSNALASSLLQMIISQPSGLSGLLETLHEKGLGDIVQSWVGTGANLPISAQQVQQVLGAQRVRHLAEEAGEQPESAARQLASLLPMIVDKLTPNGQLPQSSNLLEMGMNVLKSLGKAGTAA